MQCARAKGINQINGGLKTKEIASLCSTAAAWKPVDVIARWLSSLK
jgi:hypothetical protein